MIVKLQPSEHVDHLTADGTEFTKLPYPFFVDSATGDVQRQDVWRGKPVRVLGFTRDLAAQHVDLWWQEATRGDLEDLVGLYIVSQDKDGRIGTHQHAVKSATAEQGDAAAQEELEECNQAKKALITRSVAATKIEFADALRRLGEGAMSEPSPHRDVGPFTSSEQALAQYNAQLHGIADHVVLGGLLVLMEACLLTGLPEPTQYEREALAATPPQTAVVLAGMIIRAHLTGREQAP
jgi:hypothetical protein